MIIIIIIIIIIVVVVVVVVVDPDTQFPRKKKCAMHIKTNFNGYYSSSLTKLSCSKIAYYIIHYYY